MPDYVAQPLTCRKGIIPARPQWLANAHAALDQAVADAYGWGDDLRAGLLTDDEILARLFHLNQERAGR